MLSEDVVARGTFLSIHMMELETSIRRTELGEERTTRELPTINLQYRNHLPINGIVQVGSVVREGDVLVGKLCPVTLQTADKGSDAFDDSYRTTGAACATAYIAAGRNLSDRFKVKCAIDSSLRVPTGTRFASVIEVSSASDGTAEAIRKLKACVVAYGAVRKRYVRRVCALRRRAENCTLSRDYKTQNESALLDASYEAEMEYLF